MSKNKKKKRKRKKHGGFKVSKKDRAAIYDGGAYSEDPVSTIIPIIEGSVYFKNNPT